MVRILRVTIIAIILCSVSLFGVHAFGPTSSGFSRLVLEAINMNPDGSACTTPCMFGVRPGVTSLEESYRILQQHPFLREWQLPTQTWLSRRIMLEGMELSLHTFDDRSVSFIQLHFSPADKEHFLTYGDVVAYFGAQDSACLQPDLQYTSHYPALIVTNARSQTILYLEEDTMQSVVQGIGLTTLDYLRTYDCGWHGFQ